MLCYLEGAWTTDTTTVEEPFQSDRHHIAAESWQQLQERIRWGLCGFDRWAVGGIQVGYRWNIGGLQVDF